MAEKPSYEKLQQKVSDLEKKLTDFKLSGASSLRECENRFHLFMDYASDALFVSDLQGHLFDCNRLACDSTGYSREELLSMTVADLDGEFVRCSHPQTVWQKMEPGRPATIKGTHRRKDGTAFPVEIRIVKLELKGREVILGLARDISKRERIEAQMRLNQLELEAIFKNTPMMMMLVDRQQRVRKMNKVTVEMTRCAEHKTIGKCCGEALRCVNAFDDPRGCGYSDACEACIVRKTVQDTFCTGQDYRGVEASIPYDAGKRTVYLWVLLFTTLLELPQGRMVLVCMDDITELKRTADALKESRERYRAVVRQASDGIYLLEPESKKVIEANVALCRMIGYQPQEFARLTVYDFVDHAKDDIDAIILRAIRTGEYFVGERRYRCKDGRRIAVDASASRVSYGDKQILCVAVRDITARKQMEAQLEQASKMKSIGTLTGGIAHDFNNILGIIIGNAELAMEEVPLGQPLHANLREIKAASLRATEIVKQLLSFSRKTDHAFEPTAIGPVIREAVKFLRSTIPASIEIHLDNPFKDEIMLADPGQIKQVMMNLCINAVQAMGQAGGTLAVSLEKVVLDKAGVRRHIGLSTGNYVKLTVADTGPGIAPEIVNRIFDPYFTTREIGQGSGMGLAVVQGIVQSHSGAVYFENQPDSGAAFIVLLPLTAISPKAEAKTETGCPADNASILFIDDEVAIAEMFGQMLERLGYRVETRTNPVDALELFRAQPERFDLIITDMTMPQMSGTEFSRRAAEIRPGIPIIICTGYSTLIDAQKAEEMGFAAYLMKPVTIREIARTIQRTIGDVPD